MDCGSVLSILVLGQEEQVSSDTDGLGSGADAESGMSAPHHDSGTKLQRLCTHLPSCPPTPSIRMSGEWALL